MTEVTARVPKLDKDVTILVDLGDNCADATARFGEDVVFSKYLANTKVGVQSDIRRYIEAGLDTDAIQAKFENYKPGVTLDRVIDPVNALAARLMKMTPEERAGEIAKLQAKIAAMAG